MVDLSNEIITDIIASLHVLCKASAYLLSLRVVSKQFNEAILHVVFIRSNLKCSGFTHKPSCPVQLGDCFDTECGWMTKFNGDTSLYTRTCLQGQLKTLRPTNPGLHRMLVKLKAAVDIIEGVLDTGLVSNVSALETIRPLRYLLTTNSTFLNPVEAAVCEATLFYTESRFVLGNIKSPHTSAIARRSPEFWVLNTALYLGWTHFIEFLLSHAGQARLGLSSDQVESKLTQCLHVASQRCPTELYDRLTRKVKQLDECGLFACPLRQAFVAGDITLASTMADLHPKDSMSSCCSRTLVHTKWHPAMLKDQHVILQMLWSEVWDCHRTIHSCIITNTSRWGATEALKYLLYDVGLQQWGTPVLGPYSALCGPAMRGDWASLDMLLTYGYLDRLPSKREKSALLHAAKLALHTNNLHIFLELEKWHDLQSRVVFENLFNLDIFADLPAAEGTILMMQDRIEVYPDLLNLPARSNPRQPSVGQAALETAMKYFRIENIKYLLELDVRLDSSPVSVQWSYYSVRKDAFEATQELLRAYDVPLLHIEI